MKESVVRLSLLGMLLGAGLHLGNAVARSAVPAAPAINTAGLPLLMADGNPPPWPTKKPPFKPLSEAADLA
jgi:hypothetical protein